MIGPAFTAMFLVMWAATVGMALDGARLSDRENGFRAYCGLAVMVMTFIAASGLRA